MKLYYWATAALFVLVCMGIEACQRLTPLPSPQEVLNEPLEGLSAEQLRLHTIGDGEFGRVFGAAEGLGPIFVSNSCESCHLADGKGHPATSLTRFGRNTAEGFYPIGQLQPFSIMGYPAETLPMEATASSKFLPPAVAGLGFLAMVSEQDILAMADLLDQDGDGVSGKAAYVWPPAYYDHDPFQQPIFGRYLARFGRKASAINLLHQTVGAYTQDMGITSHLDPNDLINFQAGMTVSDHVPDPEVSEAAVRSVVFYLKTLKAPPRRNADHPEVKAGEALFTEIGCAACHKPTLKTMKTDIEALSEKTFHPYTDLLLHDMGAELDDGYTEGAAETAEWRTTPLWGLGLAPTTQGGKHYLMHDGRASTLQQAIELHGGEGAKSRAAFRALTDSQKKQLIQFLESL